jgi:clan AA aspartic protease
VIIGRVNSRLKALAPIKVKSAGRQTITVEVIVDTGFSGFLMLTPEVINTLQLPRIGSRVFSLGNNSRANFDTYMAKVIWDGEERTVRVIASEAHPIVGMSLLKGYRVTIDAVDGGQVRIELCA